MVLKPGFPAFPELKPLKLMFVIRNEPLIVNTVWFMCLFLNKYYELLHWADLFHLTHQNF
jgi:hypothetical protein